MTRCWENKIIKPHKEFICNTGYETKGKNKLFTNKKWINSKKTLKLTTDATDFAIGEVLSQAHKRFKYNTGY